MRFSIFFDIIIVLFFTEMVRCLLYNNFGKGKQGRVVFCLSKTSQNQDDLYKSWVLRLCTNTK